MQVSLKAFENCFLIILDHFRHVYDLKDVHLSVFLNTLVMMRIFFFT
jgi:hypothetical protein